MKKLFLLLSAAVFAFSCSQNKPRATYLNGELTNAPDSIVRIISKGLTDTVFVGANGQFNYQLELVKPIYLTVRVGRPTFTVYIAPGQTLTLQHDFNNAIENVNFAGELAPQNLYLAKSNKNLRSALGNIRELYLAPINAFSSKIDSIKNSMKKSLAELTPSNSTFNKLETKRIDYYFMGMQIDYPSYNSNFSGVEFPTDSIDFAFMKQVDLNDSHLMNIPEYNSLLYKYMNTIFALELKKLNDNNKSNFEKRVLFFDLVDSLITNPEIRDFVKHTSILDIIQFENLEEAKNAAELFLTNGKEPKYLNLVQAAINKRMLLAPGMPSPNFSLTGIDEVVYNLSDFRGNLVYIDFWATWCRPCREQIPHFAKLKDIYAGKPIKFVAISVDDDKEAWIKMVNEQGLKGIQVHADRAWSSDVVKKYQVRAIPTFVLIDGNGNIIEYNAPKPSNPDINLLIDKHLKNL